MPELKILGDFPTTSPWLYPVIWVKAGFTSTMICWESVIIIPSWVSLNTREDSWSFSSDFFLSVISWIKPDNFSVLPSLSVISLPRHSIQRSSPSFGLVILYST